MDLEDEIIGVIEEEENPDAPPIRQKTYKMR
jgi:hypothetical protein